MMKKHQSGLVVTVSKHSMSVQSSMLGAFSLCDAANRCLHDTCVCVRGFFFFFAYRFTNVGYQCASLIALKPNVRLLGGGVRQVP